jgi:hypothetical protein
MSSNQMRKVEFQFFDVLHNLKNKCSLVAFWNLCPDKTETEIYNLAKKYGFDESIGMFDTDIFKCLSKLNLDYQRIPLFYNEDTLKKVQKKYEKGTFLIFFEEHVCTMIDGIIFDPAEGNLGLRRRIIEFYEITNSNLYYEHPEINLDTLIYMRCPMDLYTKPKSEMRKKVLRIYRDIVSSDPGNSNAFNPDFYISVKDAMKYLTLAEIKTFLKKGIFGYVH